MDFLLLAAGRKADLDGEEHGETGGAAEMPLRFGFHAARLWLGIVPRAANRPERTAVL